MVIGQFCETDAPGGTERLIIQLATELRRRGHTVIGFGPTRDLGTGWLEQQLQLAGCVWQPVVRHKFYDPRAVTDLLHLFGRHKVDVVHSHEFAATVFGAMACWLSGRVHVATMHSSLYFARAWRRRVAFRWAVRHSAGVVAVSRDTQKDAERILRVPSDTIRVVGNGIAMSAGDRIVVRKELGVGPNDLLVASIGNLSARKAHILLLRSLFHLHERRPDLAWRLAVAGTDQGSAAELRTFVAENGLNDKVHLLGHRSDTENLLAASDVFAMSSLHEGMPLAIIEAMFASRPIISSMAGGIAEMIVHGKEGLLVPIGDVEAFSAGLERLFDDPALRRTLGEAARRRAELQFGIGPMVDSYLQLYQRQANTLLPALIPF